MRIFNILFTTIMLLMGCAALAQTTEDITQYQNTIEQTNTPADKVSLCLRYAQELIEKDQLADAEHFAQQALETATEKKMHEQAAKAWDALGVTYKDRFNYTHAMNAFSQSLKLGEKIGDRHVVSRAKYHIGLVFFKQGNYGKAEKMLLEALQLRENEHNVSGQAMSNLALAELYKEQKYYGKALESYRASMDSFIESNLLDKAAEVAVKLGQLAFTLNDTEGALVYQRQAFNLHLGNNDRLAVAKDYVQLGNSLVAQGETGEAETSFEAAQKIALEEKDSVTALDAMLCLSGFYDKQGQKAQANTWLEKSAELSKSMSVQAGLEPLLLRLSDVYASQGNRNKAYDFLQLHNNAKAAFFDLEKNRATLELHTRYQSEIAAEGHQAKIAQLQAREAMSSKLRWTLLAMLVWAFLGLWALWTRNTQKKRDNQLLTKKNAEIDEKNEHLIAMNTRIDTVNQQLVQEIAERELTQKTSMYRAENLASFAGKLKAPLSEITQDTTVLLAKSNENTEITAKLMSLQYNVNNLQVYVNDLLQYNNIEAGKLDIAATDFDIRQVVARLESSYSAFFKERDKEIFFYVDPKIPSILVGDPSKLSQIIANILQLCLNDNEYKAASLYVNLEQKYRTKCELRIVARGITKPAQLLEANLNDESMLLQQIEVGSERKNELGWLISRRLTELQNGTITATHEDSIEKLNIILPFKLPEISKFGDIENIENMKAMLNNKRVLLVEDNKINQLVVKNLLTKMSMEVHTADDGVPALEMFESMHFDLVLMDIHLPTLDGYRTTAAMRRTTDSRKSKTPVIALTASAYLTDKEKAKLFEMNEYVGKPFSTEELLEKISLTLSLV